jgi:hypothetical protein
MLASNFILFVPLQKKVNLKCIVIKRNVSLGNINDKHPLDNVFFYTTGKQSVEHKRPCNIRLVIKSQTK